MQGYRRCSRERRVVAREDRSGLGSPGPSVRSHESPRWRLVRVARFLATQTLATLTVVLSPALADPPVNQTWDVEYKELLRQIDRQKQSTKEWRDRLRAESWDPQARILAEDGDPLDVVLRRTNALLQYFQQHGQLLPAELSEFERRWSELQAAAESASPGDARRAIFPQACACAAISPWRIRCSISSRSSA